MHRAGRLSPIAKEIAKRTRVRSPATLEILRCFRSLASHPAFREAPGRQAFRVFVALCVSVA
jgi:hypothetical protein